jgi:hypothetical protein
MQHVRKPVILFFYIQRPSKVVCLPCGPIGIGDLPGQLYPLALTATGTPSWPLVRPFHK